MDPLGLSLEVKMVEAAGGDNSCSSDASQMGREPWRRGKGKGE